MNTLKYNLLLFIFFCLAALPSSGAMVDLSKIRHSVGSGDATAAILLKWNENTSTTVYNIDNIAWGLNFTPGTSVEDAFQTLLREDIRIYALYHQDSMEGIAFATYTRKSYSPKLKQGKLTSTPVDGICTIDDDTYSLYTTYNTTEKWQVNTDTRQWKYYIERNGVVGEVAKSEPLQNGDVLHVEYGAETPGSEYPYIFYIPPYEGSEWLGCFIPDMTIKSSQTDVPVPFYLNAYSSATAPKTSGTKIWQTKVNPSSSVTVSVKASKPTDPSYWLTVTPKVSSGNADVMLAWYGSSYMPSATTPQAPFKGTINIEEDKCALTDISFATSSVTIPMGEEYTALLIRTPADETDEVVNFKISNESVIDYDPTTGTITPLRIGTASITASVAASPSLTAKINVNVTAPTRPVTGITFDAESITVKTGETLHLPLTVTPDDASYKSFSWESANSSIVSVNDDGYITGKGVGNTSVSVYYNLDRNIQATIPVTVVPAHPVESISLDIEPESDGYIHIPYMGILAIKPEILPEDAEMKDFDVTISDTNIASTYSVSAHGYILPKYPELVTHKVGYTDIQIVSTDGSGVKSPVYKIKVDSPDRSIPSNRNYRDGILWLNEEWYGHTNGSINFIDANGNVHYRAYEAQNPWQAFGCTSQYATIWADKLFVMSKQASDAGDPRRNGGGRLVVANATTLKKETSFSVISGDGRACAGATPEKAYIGSHTGISPYNIPSGTLGQKLDLGDDSADLYSSQFGDMIATPERLFVIRQETGTYVIDVKTDKLITILDGYKPHGITQSADGNIWVAADGYRLICYDPETLDVLKTVNGAYISCKWSTWTSTGLCADTEANRLFWMYGNNIYCYNIDNEVLSLIYTHESHTVNSNGEYKDSPYGTGLYDSASQCFVYASTCTGNSMFSYCWYNFVDVEKGERIHDIALDRYYWFPSIPVFPQDENVIDFNLEKLEVGINWGVAEYDLSSEIPTHGHIPVNTRYTLENQARTTAVTDGDIADVSLEGNKLTIIPHKYGTSEVTLSVSAGGHKLTRTIPLTVTDLVGIDGIDASSRPAITARGNTLICRNCEGQTVTVYTASGAIATRFEVSTDEHTEHLSIPAGVYIAHADNGLSSKIVIK